ncbi:site-2 protease family protein [Candidatus Woesearchaeota archaeon]|nr:site-2 protease family protein [Candidatus Woesearchaeota archaeon]
MALFLFLQRKNIEVQKFASWLLYFAMYRTKAGLQWMDSIAGKFKKSLHVLAYVSIIAGFFGMVFISYALVASFLNIFIRPEAVSGVGLVLPIKARGVFFVPFFYWIVSIFVIALVHEFSHGIFARLYGMRVKSSGLAFLGIVVPIIPAAFVEPDEKEIKKRPVKEQLAVYSAGAFANFIVALLIFGFVALAGASMVSSIITPDGLEVTGFMEGGYPAEKAGLMKGEIITGIDQFSTPLKENFSFALGRKKPGENVTVLTNASNYTITLGSHPDDASKPYLGVYVEPHTELNKGFVERYGKPTATFLLWLMGLLYWLFVLNLGIGMFNLAPLGPLDGGRMLLVVLQNFFKEEKAVKIWKYIGAAFLFILLATMAFGFVKGG